MLIVSGLIYIIKWYLQVEFFIICYNVHAAHIWCGAWTP